jgi:hypothetical protein
MRNELFIASNRPNLSRLVPPPGAKNGGPAHSTAHCGKLARQTLLGSASSRPLSQLFGRKITTVSSLKFSVDPWPGRPSGRDPEVAGS